MNGKEDLENFITGIRCAVQSFAINALEEGKKIEQIKDEAEIYYADYLKNFSCDSMIPIFVDDAIREYNYPPREQLTLELNIETL